MRGDEKELNIDVGIITIKPEEFSAVTSRLGKLSYLNRDQHHYIYKSITDTNGLQYHVAVARCLEPGTGSAQSLATDMVEELNPTWLFLVGIAGGVPASEYSLGDVLLCTRLHDFSVCCDYEGAPPNFGISGGSIHKAAAKLLEVLPAYEGHLEACGWNALAGLHKERPTIDLNSSSLTKKLFGDESWNQKVVDSLTRNFSEPRKPKYYFGSTGSSDHLVKSQSLLNIWQGSARDLKNVEMELAGVYRAAQKKNIPILAIRSLSDIVGYERSPEWTQFACESAASFAICLIKAGILMISVGSDASPREIISVNPSAGAQTTQDDDPLLLPDESPFHRFGTIPLNNQSYVTRDSDLKLERLLSSNSFICLHGDYCLGKSSLLIRVPQMFSEGWSVFQPRLDLYQSGSKGTFEMNFFAELQGVNKEVQSWFSLDKFLKVNKLVFLIDEIGACSDQVASMFIEKLYTLVENAPPGHVRVVLTIPKSLDVYIEEIGLKNPKYYNCWETVEITKFNERELLELLVIFPPLVELSLQENLSAIHKCTSMKPNEVQRFCDGLWKYLRGKEIPIREIDQKVQYYLEEYIKV